MSGYLAHRTRAALFARLPTLSPLVFLCTTLDLSRQQTLDHLRSSAAARCSRPHPNPPLPLPHAPSHPASFRSRSYALLRPLTHIPFLPVEPHREGSERVHPLFATRASFFLSESAAFSFAGRFCTLSVPACNSLRCMTPSRTLSVIILACEENRGQSRRTASENFL